MRPTPATLLDRTRHLALATLLVACGGPDTQIGKVPVDADNDGYDESVDCNDAHAQVNPEAIEVCDGLDNDCDGGVDVDATDAGTWHPDADSDAFGDAATSVVACEAPDGHVADATDCDDADATRFPGNPEVCDQRDNDCDGEIDEDPVDPATWHPDTDADGYGDVDVAVEACEAPPDHVADATDCDDARGDIHPDAPEDDCADPTDYNCDGSTAFADADGDGAPACTDCDDLDPSRSPAAAEVCDAADTDEDCDGLADDADPDASGATSWFRDRDADGYHAGEGELVSCEAPTGYSAVGGDCDDYDTVRNPGAAEMCDAADTDEDCDGLADDADPSADAATWTRHHRDADADRYGDPSRYVDQCDAPAGYVGNDDDCDDTTAARSPAEAEVCDAADTDEDCDGLADSADPDATGGDPWYLDADRDGHGGATRVDACEAPSGYVATDGDCDDRDATVHPGATEVCDPRDTDEDCDGLVDDADPGATGQATWYLDGDADGHAGRTATAACDQPPGYLATSTDCDDADPAVNPGELEVCDAAATDEDCDGLADDLDPSVTGRTTWYRDADADGYAGSGSTAACVQPAGHLPASTDCDDGNPAVSPGDPEVCDAANADEDCDGLADDADTSATGATTWHRDADGDGLGDPAVSRDTCDTPAGYVGNDDDCDDTDGSVGSSLPWYADTDHDGWGSSTTAAACTAPSGYVATSGDCDDTDATVSPDAAEQCDAAATDEDCDGLAEEEDAAGCTVWFADTDADGWGSDTTACLCAPEGGFDADVAGDCDDAEPDIHPDAGETCGDDVDQDCDGADEACPACDTRWAGTYAAATLTDQIAGSSGEAFASALGGRGDVTGDGLDDLLVGSYAYNGAAVDAGRVYLRLAPSDTVVSLTGEGLQSGLGRSVLYLGDLDGDGRDELAAGAVGQDTAAGRVYLVYGDDVPTSTGSAAVADLARVTWSGGTTNDYVGSSLAAGDLNGDGDVDLVVGAPGVDGGGTDRGRAYFLPGPFADGDFTLSAAAEATFTGVDASASAATSVAVGDLTGDGIDDLVVGAYKAYSAGTEAGVVCVFAGGPELTGDHACPGADAAAVLYGSGSYTYAGYSVAVGDFDGDTFTDLLVGGYGDYEGGSFAGKVYVVYGPLSGSSYLADADLVLRGEARTSYAGWSVAALPDIDGDGGDELLIGAPYYTASTYYGRSYLVYGGDSGAASLSTADAIFQGPSPYGRFGFAVGPTGDLDGDGIGDWGVAAPDTPTGDGTVYLVPACP